MANKKFDKVREDLMGRVSELLANQEFDVLHTNSNELCVPIVGEDNEEGYLVLVFKVPTGSRDGTVYDGYAVAKDYALTCEAKKAKAEKSAKAKAEKIARDEKMREEKARLKAERKAKGD